MQIINRDANIDTKICHSITSKSRICNISKDSTLMISAPFEELKKEGKDISNNDDLSRINELLRQRRLAKMKVLKKQQNGGYIFVGGLTCIGVFIFGVIVFMTVRLMFVK